MYKCMGHDHRSPGMESQVHGSWVRVRVIVRDVVSKDGSVVGLTSITER